VVEFSDEPFENVIEEMKPLIDVHWNEVAMYKDKIELNPDYTKYVYLSRAGVLKTYVAREDGKLLGYCILFIQPHIHYQDDKFAAVDALYIDPTYRGKMLGVKMFRYVEQQMKELGVSVITHHIKVEHDYSPMLKRLGYNHAEVIYSKCIK
jgi:GNAT superfamily N-acetyltransferase